MYTRMSIYSAIVTWEFSLARVEGFYNAWILSACEIVVTMLVSLKKISLLKILRWRGLPWEPVNEFSTSFCQFTGWSCRSVYHSSKVLSAKI